MEALSFGCRVAVGILAIALGLSTCGIWSLGWIIPVLAILMTGTGAGGAAVYGVLSCAPILLLFGIFNVGLAFVSSVLIIPALAGLACSVEVD